MMPKYPKTGRVRSHSSPGEAWTRRGQRNIYMAPSWGGVASYPSGFLDTWALLVRSSS